MGHVQELDREPHRGCRLLDGLRPAARYRRWRASKQRRQREARHRVVSSRREGDPGLILISIDLGSLQRHRLVDPALSPDVQVSQFIFLGNGELARG